MWEFLRKGNGRCGNCGAKSLKADAKIRILVCQSCGAKNKSSLLNNFIGLFIFISFNRFISDNISSPYNWIIIFFVSFHWFFSLILKLDLRSFRKQMRKNN